MKTSPRIIFFETMILIISQELEISTSRVIDWINYLNGKFIRINEVPFIDEKFTLKINEKGSDFYNSDLNEVKVIWYRRGLNKVHENIQIKQMPEDVQTQVNLIMNSEKKSLIKSILNTHKVKWLSHPTTVSNINKIEVLSLASKYRIKIPNTLITNSKSELKEFLNQEKEVIVKAIDNINDIEIKTDKYFQYTKLIDNVTFKNLPEIFFPTLFQTKLDKLYEIRTFFLFGEFYSMCIFSQKDKQTELDFRIYNDTNPNRTVPYKLPTTIEENLSKLMKELKLDTGSIDLIKTTNNEFVFLEVNPVGQFGMVSYPCNYNLEKKIAEHLIKLAQ